MVDENKVLESRVVVCWYQTNYEKSFSNGKYPLDICKDCLPDEKNIDCVHYHSFAANFASYELARKYILDSRDRK